MSYILLNKDKVIATFELEISDLQISSTLSCSEPELMPMGFTTIEAWIENRKAHKHNAHLKELMEMCGCATTEGFIRVTHAASINDTFWIKQEDEAIEWKDVSFYTNEFDENVSKMAFEGLGLYGEKFSSTSPEFSTEGSFKKCWRREDNVIYLYKRGTDGASNAGLEPYCEMLASEVAEKICTDSVKYDLTRLHKQLASRCRLFTDEKYGYVPYRRISSKSQPQDILSFYQKYNSEQQAREMIVLDALTFNVDRHLGNHGVIIDNDTNEIVKMAPVFDFNLAMLPYTVEEDFCDIGKKMLDYGPRIGSDFTRIGQAVLNTELRTKLINMKGFKFTFRGNSTFTHKRVELLEDMLHMQLDAILSKETLYTKDVFVPRKQEKIESDTKKMNTAMLDRVHEIKAAMSNEEKYSHIEQIDEDDTIQLYFYVKGYFDTAFIVDVKTGETYIEIEGNRCSDGECEEAITREYEGFCEKLNECK